MEGCTSRERGGLWRVRVRRGRRRTVCGSGVRSGDLWPSVDFFRRTCCRGLKTRLQLRSSLATSAKKVFGKQRLTRLVNVSFPAPYKKKKEASVSFFFYAKSFGAIAKRLCNGLQIRLARFDSGSRLQIDWFFSRTQAARPHGLAAFLLASG